MIRMKWLATLAVMPLVIACARSTTVRPATERDPTTVVVDNQALLDMTIYVIRGSQRVRLGLANGLSKTRFTIPRGIVFGSTSLRFLADPVGSRAAPVSEEITLSEGEEVELRIPPRV